MLGIDLFAGAGGMTIGAQLAGVEVVAAVENDLAACNTYLHNNKKVNLYSGDIRTIQKPLHQRSKKEPLVVFGGPPCQGFSTSNQKTRSTTNSNNWLFQEFIRVVKLFNPLPEWIVFENVRGFSETENGLFLEKVLNSFKQLGYTVSYSVLNASNFGVPQKRRRFFAVASLDGICLEFPTFTTNSFVTVKSAIDDLPELNVGDSINWRSYNSSSTSEYAKMLRGSLVTSPNHCVTKNSSLVVERYKYIPQGGNWQDIPSHLLSNYKDVSRCHTGIYHRLRYDQPSIVIGNFRKNMLIHPTQDRGLSVREAARLQSFPDSYEFKGSIGFQQQQVGNAVPPVLAKAVFDTIMAFD